MRWRAAGPLPLAILWALPLLAALVAVLNLAASRQNLVEFLSQPQAHGGVLLAIWTGTAATLLALVLAVSIAMSLRDTRLWRHVPVISGAALALPHLAFAIGFGLLIMPSGVVARLLVGGDTPPQWVTTQDPAGFSLIAVLVLKEVPFLVLMVWSSMVQGNAARRFEAETKAARSLGHGMGSVWLRVLLPQVLRRMAWPIVIVWVYGVTVVDLVLVIGPTQPPTIAALIWSNLNDGDAAINALGVAGALALTLVLAAIMAVALAALRLARPLVTSFMTRGPSGIKQAEPVLRKVGTALAAVIALLYILVFAILVLLSFTPHWPYPALIGDSLNFTSWLRLAAKPVMLSIGLALSTSVAAVAMVVAWFEAVRPQQDRVVVALALAALALPALMIAAGQYFLFLRLGLTGTWPGLFLVHLTPVLAYAFIVLNGPYRSFDPRFAAAARGLGASPWRVWWRVKAPLLKAPLLSSLAVGFAVSLVQFAPAQLIAAGRFSTLPMEAVTLASGGNRSLTAAYALALALPAFAAFGLSAIFGRPRWR